MNVNYKLTEKELKKEMENLNFIVQEGNATVGQANRLAQIRKDLKRIEAVKYGLEW